MATDAAKAMYPGLASKEALKPQKVREPQASRQGQAMYPKAKAAPANRSWWDEMRPSWDIQAPDVPTYTYDKRTRTIRQQKRSK